MIKILNNNYGVDKDLLKRTLIFCEEKIKNNLNSFVTHFPSPAAKNGVYDKLENDYWTSSFWTGILWLAYENSMNKEYLDVLAIQLKTYEYRLKRRINTDTHDIGFLYTLSCIAGYKVNKNNYAKELAFEAVEFLCDRYISKTRVLQAWGSMDDNEAKGRIIIDCLMNLPLLYWVSEEKKEEKYREIAINHSIKALENLIREDYSTYHTYYFDTQTGNPIKGTTAQGYSDDSSWARGQAWAIYGFALGYRYSKKKEFLEASINTANYFIKKLPKDNVCYWDLVFTEGSQERDSSAAAIAACGLLELSKNLDDIDLQKYYKYFAISIYNSLTENYLDQNNKKLGMLKHSVYSKPDNKGVDECTIWGDYFYMELLTRLNKEDWITYW